MSFELFSDIDHPYAPELDGECQEMFKSLNYQNFAVSTLKPRRIRLQAKLQGYKVSVRKNPKGNSYIVKLMGEQK